MVESDTSKKYPNITPEWQIKQPYGLVDFDVTHVMGKYNDSYTQRGHFLCQIRWYRELFRPVVGKKGFFCCKK